MFSKIIRRIKRRKFSAKNKEIDPDEIFMDSANLPEFNVNQFEGRIEKPISKNTIIIAGVFFIIIGSIFIWKIGILQMKEGEAYATLSENNRLRHSILFADRGIFYDRNDIELAWNVRGPNDDFSHRNYIDMSGLSHILGYVSYPLKDSSGIYYQKNFIGISGSEKFFNDTVEGINGLKIVETNALMQVQSESVIRPPKDGENLKLSIDSRVQNKLFQLIEDAVEKRGFEGGAGVIIDVKNGGILSLTSFPEYDSETLSDGKESEKIQGYVNDERKPFLNRAVSGLYAPGSIIKPFIAIGALNENIISPDKQILSTGSISLPNPYFPDKKSVFTDWKAHGLVDMRHAIAVSSNVYFYEIGGGYGEQEGLGIEKIEKYARLFGFGGKTGIYKSFEEIELDGTIPNPEWKREVFDGDIWRIGDTYNTAIGQYGFQVTPIQAATAVAALANNGKLLKPALVFGDKTKSENIRIKDEYFQIVKEGMRLSVTEGIAQGLNLSYVEIAAKTGTAELGTIKKTVNSWITGFFPYEEPRYAFAVIMEKGPRSNLVGALFIMRQLFEWMNENTPEYLE